MNVHLLSSDIVQTLLSIVFVPLNNPQASISLRNNSLFLIPPPSCLDKHLGVIVLSAIFSQRMVLSPGHTIPSEIAERLLDSVSQDGGALLPHVFTIIPLHILTELASPSPLLESFQAGSVFMSARLIQNTTSGVLNRL